MNKAVRRANAISSSAGSTAAPRAGELPELVAAIAHLRANEPGAALVQVLAAWRALRAPALANLVGAIGAQIDRSLSPIAGNKAEIQTKWLDLAMLRRPVDLGRLLATLDQASLPNIRKRFELLRGFAPDPRLAGAMLALPARYSYDAAPCFTMAFEIAAQSGDPRVREILDKMMRNELAPANGQSRAWKAYLAKHARRAEKVREELPEAVAVPAAITAQVAACTAACKELEPASEAEVIAQSAPVAGKDRELDELLAAVLRAPDDDQPRAVYADALQERGDPRGELIALQLKRARDRKLPGALEARERELIKKHGRAWIAPLDTAIRADSIRFARGFLDECAVEWKTDAQREQLRRHPLWATVREIECADQTFLVQPELVSLRRATLHPSSLATLAARKPSVPLEGVIGPLEMIYGIRSRRGMPVCREKQWGTALGVGALVNLTSLQLAEWSDDRRSASEDIVFTPAWMTWLLASKLGKQLRVLDLHAGRNHVAIAPWIEYLRKRDDLTIRATFTNANTASGSTNVMVAYELAKRGDVVEVTMLVNHDMVYLRYLTIHQQIESSLEGLPTKHAPALTVKYIGSKKQRSKPGFPAIAEMLRAAFADVTLA